MKEWLSVVEAATLLDVSEKTIRRLVTTGAIRAIRPSGNPRGAIRIKRADLENMDTSGQVAPTHTMR